LQVPVFIVGVVALTTVLGVRLFARDADGQRIQHDLAQAYELLEQPQSDPNEMRRLAEDVLGHRCSNEQAAKAHFLIGIAHLRTAAQSSGQPADQAYLRVREHLEQAQALGLDEQDEPRLHFALAQCYLRSDEPPEHVVAELTAGLPSGTDKPAEGYALLAEKCRQCKPPDVDGALEAYRQLLNLPNVPDSLFWTANLASGELLLQKKDVAGARRALEKVKAPAPVKLQRKAHQLMAQSFQEAKEWEKAAAQWKTLIDHPESKQELARTLCNLGLCYRELGQTNDASAAWEEALQTAGKEEEQVAALGLAELRLGSNPTDAVAMFQRALKSVSTPENWTNSLIERKEAQDRFEAAWRHCLEEHQFQEALDIAQCYVHLGPPGKGHGMAAETAESWADSLTGAEQEKTYRTAGSEREVAAEGAASAAKAEQLCASMEDYLKGHAAAAAARVLNQLARTNQAPERVAEGWYHLAEMQLASIPAGADENEVAASRQSALDAFRQCLNYPGKFQYRARYHLAHEKIAQGDFDGAISDLNSNLAMLAVDMDREAHENTTFELADILFQRQFYRQALARLSQALELYHEGRRAYRARYQVAECHRMIAEEAQNSLRESDRLPDATQEYYRKLRQESYQSAYQAYEELGELLSAELTKDTVSDQEKSLYRASRFKEAECRFQAGDYKGALQVNQELSILYAQQVERLHALAGKRRCHFALGENDKANAVLQEVKQALDELPDSCFKEPASTWTRPKWTEWLETERRNDGQGGLRGGPRLGGAP
jgi:tetratricopeptide (TPR) repeat protein